MHTLKSMISSKGNILVEPTRQKQHILDWFKHSSFAIQSNTCNFIVLTSLVLICNVEINKSKEKNMEREGVSNLLTGAMCKCRRQMLFNNQKGEYKQAESLCARTGTTTHHVWQPDVSQAADEGAAETRQFHEQSFILLFDDFVLMFDALQVLLHGGNLRSKSNSVSVRALLRARATS